MAGRDPQALKLRPWATDGDREDPETHGIDRSVGWGVAYEQIGGSRPQRTVFNQILHEVTMLFHTVSGRGILPWDRRVNYVHTAFVVGSNGRLFRSTRASGPATGVVVDPVTDSAGQAWQQYA